MTRTALATLLALAPILGIAADHSKPKPGSNIHLTPGPELTRELTDAIAKADAEFFAAFFDTCDVDKVAGMVTDDFEFFHDKHGRIVTSGPQFVDQMKKKCERQKAGTDFLSKRTLVKGSLKVYPMNEYGAIEVGVHDFFAVVEGQPDRLTETGQFTHVWKNDGGAWKLARVLSFDHRLARP